MVHQAWSIVSRSAGPLSYRIAARGLATGMQAVALVILARQVGVGSFGALSVGFSVASISGSVLGAGSSGRALRLGREYDAGSTATSMFLVRGVSASISGTAAGFATLILRQDALSAVSLAIIVIADQICELEQAVLAGRQKQVASANWVIVQRLLPLLWILLGPQIGIGTLLSYASGSFLVLLVVIVRPVAQWERPVRVLYLLKQSSGYWAASIIGSVGSLDLIVVQIFGGAVSAGLYSAANRATNAISIFVAELLVVIAPAASQAPTQQRRGEILRIATIASASFGIALVLVSPFVSELLVTILGEQYAGAQSIITGFIVAAAISGISQTIQARLYSEGKPVVAAIAIGLGTVMGLVTLGFIAGAFGSTVLWLVPILMQVLVLLFLLTGVHRSLGSVWP